MQKPQEHEELLSNSEPLLSVTNVDHETIEPSPKSSLGMFPAGENASLKTQQLITAILAGVISSLAILSVIQIFAVAGLIQGNTLVWQPLEIGLFALVIAIISSGINFGLGKITTNQISRGIEHLQTQFHAATSGKLGIEANVYSPKELAQLAISFNQIVQVFNTKLKETQRQVEELEKEKNDLHYQLIQILQNTEEDFINILNLSSQNTTNNAGKYQQSVAAPGTILEFIDYLHNRTNFREGLDPNLFIGSNKLEEIKQHKEEVEYRELWLQALIEETERELSFLDLMIESAKNKQAQETKST